MFPAVIIQVRNEIAMYKQYKNFIFHFHWDITTKSINIQSRFFYQYTYPPFDAYPLYGDDPTKPATLEYG